MVSMPAITTQIQRIESQNSFEFKFGKPVNTVKLYFNDAEHLKEQIKELIDWDILPQDLFINEKGGGNDDNE